MALHKHHYGDDMQYAGRGLLYMVVLTVVGAFSWAYYFDLDEITKGQGKVISSSREQVIQARDMGTIVDISVEEGQEVKRDEVLVKIDPTRMEAGYNEIHEKWVALVAVEARLKAESMGLNLSFPASIKAERGVIARETDIYHSRLKAMQDSVTSLSKSLGLVQKELAMTEPMVAQGVVSNVELFRLRRQESEIQNQLSDRQNRFKTEAGNELTRVSSELAQTHQNSIARHDAMVQTVIKSPMAGVVKNIRTTTIGAVVQAGQDIMEIVPVGEELLVEAFIKPADIAFVHVGQRAMVKFSAYDFGYFGGIEGTLMHVSPDTLKDERQQKPGNPVALEEGHYRVIVKLEKGEIVYQGKSMPIMPGMVNTIDIRTGHKTVLEYILRPLQRVSEALTEK
jgi:adhesin transport system membrane fusion protein